MTHGTRGTYRHGCSCVLCRAANAAYEARRSADRRAGRVTLGQIVSPQEAMKRIKQFKAERLSGRALNRAIGLKDHPLVVHPSGITVRRVLQIRRIYRQMMLGEGPDQPVFDAHS